MANAIRFPIQKVERPEGNLEDEKLRLARMLIATLPSETQAALARDLLATLELSAKETPGPATIIATILKLLPRGKEVTAAELRKEVADRGVEAEPKQVYNAIDYMIRSGRLRRVSYGRFLVDGMEIETSDDLGGERDRHEDISDDER